jgi:hypothetical protein
MSSQLYRDCRATEAIMAPMHVKEESASADNASLTDSSTSTTADNSPPTTRKRQKQYHARDLDALIYHHPSFMTEGQQLLRLRPTSPSVTHDAMDVAGSHAPGFYPYPPNPWHPYYHNVPPPHAYPSEPAPRFSALESHGQPSYPTPTTRSSPSVQEVSAVEVKPAERRQKRRHEDDVKETTEVEVQSHLSATYIDDPLYLRQQIIGK